MLPRNPNEEKVKSNLQTSTGQVWKVAVELMQSKNIDFVIANIDHGVGIIKPKNDYEFIQNKELKDLNFKHFKETFYSQLPIVTSEEALEFI